MRKKKIVWMSDSSATKTGFGRNTKALLTYLHKTGKYDLVEYCCGRPWSNDVEHSRKPWKSFGTLPDNPNELNAIAPNDQQKRIIAYGSHYLDRIIYQEKPDIFFGIQDIWGIDFAADRQWFNKVTSVLWTTLDSLPIIKSALDIAPKVQNYWVWSSFAEVAMKKLGHNQVKTVHGAIDASKFFALKPQQKQELRKHHNIPSDAFIAGFVFRNQPRKSVPNLIEGFKIFKQNNPELKNPRLLLHTHWNEGWRIHDLADEYNIPHNEILTTYVCSQCRSYKIQEYKGEHIQCPYCQKNDGFVTTGPGLGVSEEQLNEVYNFMDIYVGAFNSGGQELPIQEAKFCELITAVTNYSCGEEACEEGAGSLPLDWQQYREPDSQFIKATTLPSSIAKQMTKVYKMTPDQRVKMGKQAREWALKNYSIENVGKLIENFIDSCPFAPEEAFIPKKDSFNPFAEINSQLDNEAWVIELYSKIFGREIDKYDSGVRSWVEQLKRGQERAKIENHFRGIAVQQKQLEHKQNQFAAIKQDTSKKILYVMPASERDVFLSTALFRSIKEQYPGYKLYVATEHQYQKVLDGNPYIDSIINYYPEMDNLIFLEGSGGDNGYFDIAFLPHLHTQRVINYLHNGQSRVAFGECISYGK